MNRDSAFDLDNVIAEAEACEARPAGKSQIREMAERMAAERREKMRRSNLLVLRAEAVVFKPLEERRQAELDAAPVQAKLKTLPKSKSVQLLRALPDSTASIDLRALHKLLPGIESTSIAAYLVSFVGRGWAIRYGTRRFYTYAIGPKGEQYLQTFHPPD